MRVANNKLLARRHWGTLVEASLALAAASAATRLLPFKRYIGLGARPLPAKKVMATPEIGRIVDALGRRLPFRAVCLQQGIALQWMLRRRGVEAILHYGVQLPKPSGEIRAHVWVSVGGQVLIGAPQHADYTEVAHYPAGSALPLR
ncbi:lasso peptide biosynthesis B2 protein [Sphingomonas glaciei]|uniref:Lasso peptide biosynthesis B2 protein n=1 Tax=Sphingomonas glaciei TaxID=2938948 RepID=A0ABY5MWN6_9SPHN|nr:lasso peptide biosynthesis B2 protein [Sphingomonas glaciei]UUR08406.1 lasso peptide biosynthesis B2 protein [Sphingomonas glaciei]